MPAPLTGLSRPRFAFSAASLPSTAGLPLSSAANLLRAATGVWRCRTPPLAPLRPAALPGPHCGGAGSGVAGRPNSHFLPYLLSRFGACLSLEGAAVGGGPAGLHHLLHLP
eukprot:EG_transcript_19951